MKLGRRVSEDWALAHLRSVIYGGEGRWIRSMILPDDLDVMERDDDAVAVGHTLATGRRFNESSDWSPTYTQDVVIEPGGPGLSDYLWSDG